jgi:hypothetical protein
MRQPLVKSLRARIFGPHRRLAVPRGNQFRLDLGALRRRQFGLFTIGRQVVNRKPGTSFLRTRRCVGGRAEQRHIRDRTGATAERKRRQQQQRSQGQCPLFSIHRHPSGSPRFASLASQPPDAYFIYFINYRSKRSNHCRPKRLKPEQQIGPLGLQYDRTKILCRSATREISRLPSSIRGDEPEMKL